MQHILVERFLSKKDVTSLTTLSRAHIDRLEKAGSFPRRIEISRKRVVWLESEICEWQRQKIGQRLNAAETFENFRDSHVANSNALKADNVRDFSKRPSLAA